MRKISLVSDWEFEFDVTRKATTTGTKEAAAGLTAVAWLSLTDGGTAITGTSTNLTERSATAGRYYGLLDKAAVNTAIGAVVGSVVYQIWSVSGDDLKSEPLLVVPVLPPA